jgi:hypothetical protein
MIAILAMSGCFSIGMGQRAETLGKKGWEVGIEPSVIGVVTDASSKPIAGQPKVQIAGRYGLCDRVDVGLRLGTPYFGVTTKVMLTTPGAGGPVVSAGLETGLIPDDRRLAWHVSFPLFVGFPVGVDDQVVLTPRIHAYNFGGGLLGTLGSGVGYVAQLGPVAVIPEVAVEASPADLTSWYFDARISLVFGHRTALERRPPPEDSGDEPDAYQP